MDDYEEGAYKEYKCFVLMSAITEMIDEVTDQLVFVPKRALGKQKPDVPPVLPIGNLTLGQVIDYTKKECPHHYLTEDIEKGYKDIKELGFRG